MIRRHSFGIRGARLGDVDRVRSMRIVLRVLGRRRGVSGRVKSTYGNRVALNKKPAKIDPWDYMGGRLVPWPQI